MTDEDGALFDVPELLEVRHRMGRTEAGLMRALRAAEDAGILLPEDAGLVGSALVGARALDAADENPNSKTGYLVAALLTPYRETLHALRLPAATVPVGGRVPGNSQPEGASSLHDLFGTPEG